MSRHIGQFNPLFKAMPSEPYATSAWKLMKKGRFNSIDVDLDSSLSVDQQMKKASKLKKEAEKWKIKILCFHSSPLSCASDAAFDIDTQITNMKIALEYGVRFFLIHPYMSSSPDLAKLSSCQRTKHMKFNLDSISIIAKNTEKYGLRLIVENELFTDFDFYFTLLKELPSEKCGAVLDIGHANLQLSENKIPMQDIIYHLSARLEHLHLHDNDGFTDLHVPVLHPLGTIKWNRVFKALKDVKYHGCLNEELPPWTGNALIIWALIKRGAIPLKELWDSI